MGMNIFAKVNGEVVFDKTVEAGSVAPYVAQIVQAHKDDELEILISPEALPVEQPEELTLAA